MSHIIEHTKESHPQRPVVVALYEEQERLLKVICSDTGCYWKRVVQL